jgi:diacylglycerol kinase family enzyme
MRALLVYNPFATSTSESTRDQIAEKLESVCELTLQPTTGRNAAIEIARSAKDRGFEIVIGYGGDGTVNELANGLLHQGPNPNGPRLAALPGGNANVFARNLNYSADPLEAADQLTKAIASNHTRVVGVGSVTTQDMSRWFLFNAGLGIDAEVLMAMDERRQNGKRASDLAYTLIAGRKLVSALKDRNPHITLRSVEGEFSAPLHFALIINVAPWIYLGARPLTLTPGATHDKALSVFAPKNLSLLSFSKIVRGIAMNQDLDSQDNVFALADQNNFSLRAQTPTWLQVDGEVLSQVKEVAVSHTKNALTVYA